MTNKPDCCKDGRKGLWTGLTLGLVPHIGCIAFIAFTLLGVTAATAFLKPLLLNPYFFYILIGLSFVLATLSAVLYLRMHGMLSFSGAKTKWKYLSFLYGTTIGVNLLLFMFVFPMAANFVSGAATTSVNTAASTNSGNTVNAGTINAVTLKVDIPCPGHASLITGELKTIQGVTSVKFRFPNLFDVTYDSRTSEQEILGLEIFNQYKATVQPKTL